MAHLPNIKRSDPLFTGRGVYVSRHVANSDKCHLNLINHKKGSILPLNYFSWIQIYSKDTNLLSCTKHPVKEMLTYISAKNCQNRLWLRCHLSQEAFPLSLFQTRHLELLGTFGAVNLFDRSLG